MPTIGGVNVGWDEGKPQGSDSLGIGDDQIRSDKTALRNAIGAEHIFDSGGGANTGAHVFGSARPYYGPQSLVSSTGSDGRLMFGSDTSQFFHVGSGGTAFIGGARAISAGSYPGGTPPQRYQWVTEFGSQTITGTGSQQIIFPNSGFSGRPFVFVSAYSAAFAAGATGINLTLVNVAPASFDVVAAKGASLISNYTLMWHSIGTRVL